MTRDVILASVDDRIALVATLYGEARGEAIESKIAVACVIRNRVMRTLRGDGRPDWWGEGYRGVCLAPAQFSCWHEVGGNTDEVFAVAEALLDRQPVGDLVQELDWIAQGIIGGALRDVTKSSDHYLTTALLHSPVPPKWARNATPTARIGSHTFFRLT